MFAKDVRGLRNSLRNTVNYFSGDNPSSIKRQIRDFEDFWNGFVVLCEVLGIGEVHERLSESDFDTKVDKKVSSDDPLVVDRNYPNKDAEDADNSERYLLTSKEREAAKYVFKTYKDLKVWQWEITSHLHDKKPANKGVIEYLEGVFLVIKRELEKNAWEH